MNIVKKYRLKRELPRYEKGTVIVHEYQQLPSQYNSGTYLTKGEWYTEGSKYLGKTMTPDYVAGVIERALTDHNVATDDWVEEIEVR